MNWILLWLSFHVLAAIVGFGPTFAYPFIGVMAQKEPQHVSFALRLQELIGKRLIIPVVLTMAVSGVGLLFTVRVNLTKTPYLIVAIVLYLTAVYIGIGVLTRNGTKLVRMAEKMPAAPPGGVPSGPPPEFLALIRQQQVFGAINQALIVVIVLLMIIKPSGIVAGPLFG